MKRPGWWERWIPQTCGNGHELLPGNVSQSYVQCPECPASANDDRGHHLLYCATADCHWHMAPPDCIRPAGH